MKEANMPDVLTHSDFALSFYVIDAKKFSQTGERRILSTPAASLALRRIVRGYTLSPNSLEVELSATEDFVELTSWLLLDYAGAASGQLPAFQIELLNSVGAPVMKHSGVAATCGIDPYTSGHRFPAGDSTEGAEPFDLVASLVFNNLKAVKLFQPV